jgi:hypothetical protein
MALLRAGLLRLGPARLYVLVEAEEVLRVVAVLELYETPVLLRPVAALDALLAFVAFLSLVHPLCGALST